MGGSAGGHLALMVGYTTGIAALNRQSRIRRLGCGAGGRQHVWHHQSATRQRIDAQGNPTGQRVSPRWWMASPKRTWKRGSLSHRLPRASGMPPTLILHGMADATVDRDQATELAAKLKQVGVEHELVMVEESGTP